MRDGQWGHGDQLEYDDQWVLRRREVCLQIITDLVMAIRILDKDITKIVKIPRLSSRVLFLTREGRDGGMI